MKHNKFDLFSLEKAAMYLNKALQESMEGKVTISNVFFQAMKNVRDAQGGLPDLSIKGGISTSSLYRTFISETQDNTHFRTVIYILGCLGFRLKVITQD